MAGNRLRILCLHGYGQNANVFQEKLGGFRRFVKHLASFSFLSAPHPLDSPISVEKVEERAWWLKKDENEMIIYRGFEESVLAIERHVQSCGPFDGILGFSQGATMVGLLCGLKQQKKLNFDFKFAILFAGFCSRSQAHQEIYKEQIILPSLHVIGETDQIIPIEEGERLTGHFLNPTILRHKGGHHVPSSGPQKDVYRDSYRQFLESFTSNENGDKELDE
ncbi:esterase CG5412-like [Penaeus chinensis]|uniref:esterase CG5412-like n=1 Tax=Penaeus chinensis TaxID=139456 RepID=UPI001FB7BFFA|nr:esterase CG5412-like [Penaeus chinensis]